jgi:hypothetical protein
LEAASTKKALFSAVPVQASAALVGDGVGLGVSVEVAAVPALRQGQRRVGGVVHVERMRELVGVGGRLEAVAPQERELHHRRDRESVPRAGTSGVVGVDVHAGVGAKSLFEGAPGQFEERLAPQEVEPVELDDDDPEPRHQGLGRGQECLVFVALDVHLEQQIRIRSWQ